MNYSNIIAPALLALSLLATTGHAAPMDKPVRPSVETPLPTPPVTPALDKLTGKEFPPSPPVLPDVSLDKSKGKRPPKPGKTVPEPSGLILMGLGVLSMGVLRLRTKAQEAKK
ncbi:MAG: hypothetical protein RL497_2400 [Pseudomonadota bacterium]|jgi:hypothetical protein